MTETERREFLRESLKTTGAVLTLGVLAGTSCNRQSEIRNPTRAELVKRLQKLAKSRSPKNLSLGAMCYEMVAPMYKETPCPTCERTMIVGQMDEILRAYNVPLKRIQDQGVNAKLIIPKHCPQCGFGLIEEKFQLEITYPDHPEPVRVELLFAHDLELMVIFLHGKDRYEAGQGREQPLQDKVDRLRELFGVKE